MCPRYPSSLRQHFTSTHFTCVHPISFRRTPVVNVYKALHIRYKALYDFEARGAEELSFQQGDVRFPRVHNLSASPSLTFLVFSLQPQILEVNPREAGEDWFDARHVRARAHTHMFLISSGLLPCLCISPSLSMRADFPDSCHCCFTL